MKLQVSKVSINEILESLSEELKRYIETLNIELCFTNEQYARLFEKLAEGDFEIAIEELDIAVKLVKAGLASLYLRPTRNDVIKYILERTGRAKFEHEKAVKAEISKESDLSTQAEGWRGAMRCDCGGRLIPYHTVGTFKGERIMTFKCEKCGKVIREYP